MSAKHCNYRDSSWYNEEMAHIAIGRFIQCNERFVHCNDGDFIHFNKRDLYTANDGYSINCNEIFLHCKKEDLYTAMRDS